MQDVFSDGPNAWVTMITLSLLEFAEEDRFRDAYVVHPCDVASPAHLVLKQAGSFEYFFF